MGQKHLTKTHREIIERWLGTLPIRGIARIIGYSPAAVTREIKRNSNKNGTYDAESAQRRAVWRASKDKNAGKRTPFLTAYVQEKLAAYWSPEQIAGRLRLEFPDEPVYDNLQMQLAHSRKSILPSRRCIVGASRMPSNTTKAGRSGGIFVTFATKGPANALSMTKNA